MTTRPNHPLPRQDLHLQVCQRLKAAHNPEATLRLPRGYPEPPHSLPKASPKSESGGVESARGLAQSKTLERFEVGNWLPLCSHGFVRWLAVVFCWRLVGLLLVLLARSAVCADLPLEVAFSDPPNAARIRVFWRRFRKVVGFVIPIYLAATG